MGREILRILNRSVIPLATTEIVWELGPTWPVSTVSYHALHLSDCGAVLAAPGNAFRPRTFESSLSSDPAVSLLLSELAEADRQYLQESENASRS